MFLKKKKKTEEFYTKSCSFIELHFDFEGNKKKVLHFKFGFRCVLGCYEVLGGLGGVL